MVLFLLRRFKCSKSGMLSNGQICEETQQYTLNYSYGLYYKCRGALGKLDNRGVLRDMRRKLSVKILCVICFILLCFSCLCIIKINSDKKQIPQIRDEHFTLERERAEGLVFM